MHRRRRHISACCAVAAFCSFSASGYAADLTLRNRQETVVLHESDGSYEIQDADLHRSVIHAQVAAEVNDRWVRCGDYPRRRAEQSEFQDGLGRGTQATMSCTGLMGQPDLSYTVRLYGSLREGSIEVQVRNTGQSALTVEALRPVQGIGAHPIDTGGPESSNRILDDSFSEDWPPLKIYDFDQAPDHLFLAVGSQMIYNRASHTALFFGALTSDRFLTIMHWRVDGARGETYTVDSTGTTEIQATDEESGLADGPKKNLIEVRLPLAEGASLHSEPLMFATGQDYLKILENYGAAIRTLHRPRPRTGPIMGWWSWTAFYAGITQGNTLTNAQWLAEHLKRLGFDFFHLDLGYAYARGEYATPNAAQFPGGLLPITHEVCHLGLRMGFWTAPFEVSNRSWVYQHHRDWLVHNAEGQPISIGVGTEAGREVLYVLDATNPAAHDYLRYTYRVLTRKWGAQYIKLDFMDNTAIEGYYYRPHTTALEAQRIGLQVIRDAVGPHVLLDKDGSPMLNTVGLVDEGRLSQDTGHTFLRSREAAPGIAARFYMNHNFFMSDPDAFTVSKQVILDSAITRPLTLPEAEASITLAALAGGMFEIGDDLPSLGESPRRLALVENQDLIQMIRLGQSAIPLDLLTYREQDEQPSIFLLREDRRQAMLAVFNWTQQPRSHELRLADLGLPAGATYSVTEVFHPGRAAAFENDELRIENQAPHSVRLLKIIDESVPAQPPSVTPSVPRSGKVGQDMRFSATASPGVPPLGWTWDFGDGVTAQGREVEHTYTHAGTFQVQLAVEGVDGVPYRSQSPLVVSGTVPLPPPKRFVAQP